MTETEEKSLYDIAQSGALNAHDEAVTRGLHPELAWTAPLWIAMQTARQVYGEEPYLLHVMDTIKEMGETLSSGVFEKPQNPDDKPRWSRWSDG